jgi:hypothetical protein
MAELTIAISDERADDEELDELTRRVRRELLEAGADDVRLGRGGQAEDGAKGDPMAIGSLVIGLGSSAAVTALITGSLQVLRSWVIRRSERTVVLQLAGHRLKLKGGSPQEQQRAIDRFTETVAELRPESGHERHS